MNLAGVVAAAAGLLETFKWVGKAICVVFAWRKKKEEDIGAHNKPLKQEVKDAFKADDSRRIGRSLSRWLRLRK